MEKRARGRDALGPSMRERTLRWILVACSTSLLPMAAQAAGSPLMVGINLPANGSYARGPANLSIQGYAIARTAGAKITRVDFYNGTAMLGTVTGEPYICNLADVGSGHYSLTIKATDSLGQTATSTANAFDVLGPPKVEVSAWSPGTKASAPPSITSIASTCEELPARSPTNAEILIAREVASRAPTSTTGPSDGATGNAGSAPGISIVSPASYSAFAEPATVPVDATAFGQGRASVVKVEFYDGQQLVGTLTRVPYRFVWNNLPAGGYSIRAKATDSNGVTATSAPLNFVVNQVLPLSLAIDTPLAAATVNDDHVNVSGTVHAPPNSGVRVNGVLGAILADGTFFANSVPLVNGSNKLTATVTTIDGETLSQSVTVTRSGTGPLRVNASGTAGLAPAKVRFHWNNTAGVTVTHLDLSCRDDGAVQFTTTDINGVQAAACEYKTPGNTRARVNVYAERAGGGETLIYTDSWQIKVDSGLSRYSLVRGVLFQLMTRLKAGDTAGAARLFATGPAERYRAIFNSTGRSTWAKRVDQLGRINQTSLSDTSAEFLLSRPSDSGGLDGFEASLMLDGDGIWRFESL